nr:SNF2-related protein [Acinetobacter ursingii]
MVFDEKNHPPARLPLSFRSQEFGLKPHQEYGVAWLQNLHQYAPEQVSGCLLADDMGLGKTLQLLCFIGEYLENAKDKKPVLVVAPVSLLENWEAEANRFFSAKFAKILSLYGENLKDRKIPKHLISAQLRDDHGITHLLEEEWLGDADIVLTTYETMRDLEFSLARVDWGIMVCDEAQKIKVPTAMVTKAAKAQKADFKIACTGTPVENSLTDLWCLFDFIQENLLGSLSEFNKIYRRPIEMSEDVDDPRQYRGQQIPLNS